MTETTKLATSTSLDFFQPSSISGRGKPSSYRRQPLELKLAGALCRQMRRTLARREKQRIAHLICLNLISMLKHREKHPAASHNQ